MSEAGPYIRSLRQDNRENRWLYWAVVVSLFAHLALWGGYEVGKKNNWWPNWPAMAWLKRTAEAMRPKPPVVPAQPIEQEPQLAFLPVADPDDEAPKKPKFYSNNNSHAANVEPAPDLQTPKLTGKQTEMLRTETANHTHFSKAPTQPDAKPRKVDAQPPAEPEPAQPKPLQLEKVVKAGDLAEGKPQETPQQTEPPHPPKPRTIREALAQRANQVEGLQMHQDGGVERTATHAAEDAKRTLFGDYDALMEQAIQAKFDELLDARNFAWDCTGRATVRFKLHDDGTVSDVRLLPNETTVPSTWAYVCVQSINASAPYARWPDQLRREIGSDVTERTWVFLYLPLGSE